jgi:Fur family ferric uptake transcriptional regulator
MDHPDVDLLYQRATVLDPNISIATVYRTVRLFEEANILEKHDFGDGRARYEETSNNHHDHLINIKNGEVIEFYNDEIERLKIKIAKELGYDLVDHRLELYATPRVADEPSDGNGGVP